MAAGRLRIDMQRSANSPTPRQSDHPTPCSDKSSQRNSLHLASARICHASISSPLNEADRKLKNDRLCYSRLLNGDDAGLNICLVLQSASHSLVVLLTPIASFDVGLGFQATSNGLIMLRAFTASFDVRFDLKTTRNGLVVVWHHITSFDATLDLQAASQCLVVLLAYTTSFDVSVELKAASNYLIVL